MKIEDCMADFQIPRHLHYMDNAATSLIPEPVIASMNEYDRYYRANVGRGMHRLTRVATQKYQDAHDSVSGFIGGKEGTTVFTRNTTEAINMVAAGLDWKPGDRVVTTIMEHHSNLLPWLRLRQKGVEVAVVYPGREGVFDIEAFDEAITADTKLVAVNHASNVLGTVQPVREIAAICKERGAYFLVDGAQSVPHFPVNAQETGCDFLCFSGHKMLGPTGIGVLWMREAVISPLMVGGGTVEDVTTKGYTLTGGYKRYEAGTPHISGAIGLARAVKYLESLGMDAIFRHEQKLTERLLSGLAGIDNVTIYGPQDTKNRIGVVSFNVGRVHPHEIAYLLDERAAVLVRSGDHCCIPLMRYLGLENGTVRASLYLYNTLEEVDLLIETIEEIARVV
ncbi:aminotransferase class V [Methanosarcina sp. 2.H.T.1A.6]|uniref:cysteine desulfurase n=1 Tax=unclassified Methanosarcina TaxID=2644672 RepID=UPI0006227F6D|nr:MULTISPECIES: cysteine desulfurase [unclassified Methanosarcina]KKG18164.1 aminotransferase class V [Methanosarcina sp. 2.H.T.1A.3]KKG19071.1 aminotransferase class V [Methanosarcina sp. 2.H.T.1A.15]KKG19387.1 aminotransferase class V [Methanosarcina sp. 2.H.T.1A.6]KKG25571.1 aminotransferase class V [Methanosarcina sp. 2.H.T.1A.8]